MNKIIAIINAIILAIAIYWNYYTASVGYKGKSIGELSDKYYNLFTPADYAFSIWGLIFLGLIISAIYLIKNSTLGNTEDQYVSKIGAGLIVANIGNILWTWAWLEEYTGLSVVIMTGILLSLLYTVNQSIKAHHEGPSINRIIHSSIGLYAGWISVAIIANIAAHLNKNGWQPFITETHWTILMMIIATLIFNYMVSSKKVISFGLVGIWALTAISIRHWDSNMSIKIVALISAITIAFNIIASLLSANKK